MSIAAYLSSKYKNYDDKTIPSTAILDESLCTKVEFNHLKQITAIFLESKKCPQFITLTALIYVVDQYIEGKP